MNPKVQLPGVTGNVGQLYNSFFKVGKNHHSALVWYAGCMQLSPLLQ